MHISESQSSISKDLPSLHEARYLERSLSPRKRSHSVNEYDHSRLKDFTERIKHTFEYKLKTFKGNTRGQYIHQPFITLETLLRELPVEIPLNVEISKLPFPS